MNYLYVCIVKLVNTGWRLGQYRRRYIFQDFGRFEVENGDSKNMGGLRIMPKYGIKNKKKRFGYRSVPLRFTLTGIGAGTAVHFATLGARYGQCRGENQNW